MSDKVLGIDLGTTYSCIATVKESGTEADVIANKESKFTTPSVVNFADPTMVIVGDVAKENAVIDPQNTVSLVKTLMGRTDCAITYNGERKSPEEVSSYILRKVTGDASSLINDDVKNVVITCPAYFGTLETEATKNAGVIAGLNVLEIINEPTAAAIFYGCTNSEKSQTVLVYDLGGGTFDVTVMRIEPGVITMICSDGNHDLGGKNWDNALMNYIAQEFCASSGFDGEFDEFAEQDLRIKAERAKISLTEASQTRVPFQAGDKRGQVIVTREVFDEITENLLNESLEKTDNAIAAAKDKGFDVIDEILLVGGSTKMPQVKDAIVKRYGKEPLICEPDFAVAKGAALYAANLMGKLKIGDGAAEENAIPSFDSLGAGSSGADDLNISIGGTKGSIRINIITTKSYALEVLMEDKKPMCRNMILKNEQLPESGEIVITKTFGTAEANMETAELKVYESDFLDEYYDIDEQCLLGTATLQLPGNLPEHSPIEVTFALNKEGILNITGKDVVGGNDITATLTAKGIMTQEQVEEIKSASKQIVVL